MARRAHQAALIRVAIDDIVRMNPWLTETIEVQRHQILNPATGSSIEIISGDAASSYGHTVDFIVCDELTHWKKRDLWDSLFREALGHGADVVFQTANHDVIEMTLEHFHAAAKPLRIENLQQCAKAIEMAVVRRGR